MTVEEYFGDWAKVINLKEADRILRELSASNQTICPQIKDVFKAFTLCPFNDLRVVIIGDAPYSQKGVATGLAFANRKDTPENSISPSLEILRESIIDNTVPHGTINFDLSLEEWAKQGVLLINSALTCEAGKSFSHISLWRLFMMNFLSNLQKYHTGIIYVLLGDEARELDFCIKQHFNKVIKGASPFHYLRNGTGMLSYIWKEINHALIDKNGYGIDWYQEY